MLYLFQMENLEIQKIITNLSDIISFFILKLSMLNLIIIMSHLLFLIININDLINFATFFISQIIKQIYSSI